MSWVDRTRRVRRHARVERERPVNGHAPVELPLVVPELVPTGNGTNSNGANGTGTRTGGVNGRLDTLLGVERTTSGPWSATRPDFRPGALHEADMVAVLSVTGRLVFVSASAERLLGYDVSDAVGLDALGLFAPESQVAVGSLFDDLVARRRLSVALEVRCRRNDGREIDLELLAANHLDDPVEGIVVTFRDISERKAREGELLALERRQDSLIESLADGLVILDAAGKVLRVNEAFEVMFWAPRIRVHGRYFDELIEDAFDRKVELFDEWGVVLPVDRHPVLTSLRQGRRVDGAIVGHRTGDGPAHWMRIGAQAMIGADGQISGAVATFSDITDVKRSAAKLRQEEEFHRVLLDTLDEGIVACDADGRMTIFNPAARRIHVLDDEVDPIGRVPSSLMLLHGDGTVMEAGQNPLLRALAGEQLRNDEVVLAFPGGEQRRVSVNGQALVDEDGWKLGAVVAMHDVTEQRRNEERLADLAHHDPLTRLANRTLLATRMAEAVNALRDQRVGSTGLRVPDASATDRVVPEHPGVAVYLLDLDNFKEVNDEFGHDVGDDLLVAVAGRLLAIVRPTDTVARLGGDEFVVVCEIESGEEEMLAISRRISSALARPYRIDGRTLVAEASVGGVFVDDPDTDPSKLLSLADDAMYGVKWSRRSQRRPAAD